MFEHESQPRTRRFALRAGLAAALPVAGLFPGRTEAQTRPVTKVLDFTTSADLTKAEQEGELLFYTHDGEAGASGAIDAFNKDFPKIKAAYVRAQTGALYSKILAERSAGRFDVDVIQFSDTGTAIDFYKRGAFDQYISPESAAYEAAYLGDPAGFYFCSGMTFAGIAYNTDKVKPEDAPKSWKDLLNPRWANVTST
jgi:iron(III) transport system substrate-binding protein